MKNKVEELASKVVGTAKAAKATLEGLSGVFRHLAKEHGEVSALLMRLKASSDPAVRRELFPKIRRELLAHEQAELRELYPALRSNPQTEQMANEHDRDAVSLESAIDALTAIAVDSPHWQPTLEALIERVEQHVHQEEDEYFPVAQRVFQARASELLERFEQAKAEAMRELNSTP
jgi:iron-sulfur cluster repair protein YtfE (RIC family)